MVSLEQNVLNTDLTGKVAVVTGAGGVLCSAFDKALARAGAKVALLSLHQSSAQRVADDIAAEGYTSKAYGCDVTDKAACMAVANAVLADLGPCDILINGASGNHPCATTDKEYFEPGDLDGDLFLGGGGSGYQGIGELGPLPVSYAADLYLNDELAAELTLLPVEGGPQ